MKFERLLILSAFVFFLSVVFLLGAIYLSVQTQGRMLRSVGIREFSGKEVEIYQIEGFGNVVISISKQNQNGEIVISNSEESAPLVEISVVDQGIQKVASINSSMDYVVIKTDSSGERFASLERITEKSETSLRGQVDQDLDGVMDKEVEIPK